MVRSGRGALQLVFAGLLSGAAGCGTDCEKLRKEAKDLRHEYEACSAGDTCQIVDMYEIAGTDNCLAGFQCSTAVRQGTDLAAFKSRARAIVDEYKSGCNECAIAGCIGTTNKTAECNTATGRCEIVQ